MMKILVIDDDASILRGLSRVINHDKRFRCTSCLPSQAYDIIKIGEKFDFVLSDVMMGEITGPELKSKLTGFQPDLKNKYMFMSGYVSPETIPSLKGESVINKINLSGMIISILEKALF